ncbi:MAG: DUF1080 domain-containing protein [Acidobacteria bacterium]|nr:MAG: DUF1080 domain-containing protein [Acidobacteriota bacterium]
MKATLTLSLVLTSLVLTVVFHVPALAVAVQQGGEDDGSWDPLFNGRDLDGWTVKCKPEDSDKGFWRVDNGTILADSIGRKGHDYVWLTTNREYGDFVLRLEFQAYRSSPGNSGVQIRSRYNETERWLNGPQVDIHPPGPWRTGMMWDETRGNQRWIYPDIPKDKWVDETMSKPARIFHYGEEGDAWNSLEISARGTRVTAVLNGVVITDYEGKGVLDDELHQKLQVGRKGVIALQIHTGDELRIRYRNIRIKVQD